MFSCPGLDHVVNRHAICLEASESYQASEMLPIERQDPKEPQVVNTLSLVKVKNLISFETSLLEQSSLSNGKKCRRCTQCQIRRKKASNCTSELR